MFKRSFAQKDRVGKLIKPSKRSFRDNVKQKMAASLDSPMQDARQDDHHQSATRQQQEQNPKLTQTHSGSPALTSSIITVVVGREERLFAAHEDVLSHSPFLATAIHEHFFQGNDRRIFLPDEEPEIFSCVLEYLYKGDYSPRLVHDKRHNSWMLEGAAESPKMGGRGNPDAAIYHSAVGDFILRDTAVYCAADRYGLEELKKLALRKQGLQAGVSVATILASARYAYDNTPESDSRLRAHYLALIIRSRKTFKRSGTMQSELTRSTGNSLYFDLFVALCNHLDDMSEVSKGTPKTI